MASPCWTALLLVALLALALSASATPALPPDVVKERIIAPRGWTRYAVANDSEVIPLRIALKQAAPNSIERMLDRTSDPDSPHYLDHLSREQVLQLLKPSSNSSKAVNAWLDSHNVTSIHVDHAHQGDSVSIHVPVHKARRMLNADFSVFEHHGSGERVVRTTEYSLPRSVADHVEYVGGTTYFSTLRSLRSPNKVIDEPVDLEPLTRAARISRVNVHASGKSQPGVPSACNSSQVTSLCLRELYGTKGYKPRAPKKTHIGIAGFLGEKANYQDLNNFLKVQRPDALRGNATFDYVTINGEHNNQSLAASTGEAALDVQTVVGMTYPIRTSFYSVGGKPPFKKDKFTPTDTNEPYAELLEYLLRLPDHELPDVLSISYGDDEQTVPPAYARRVCTLIAALGLRGVSVFDSSGDQGVGGSEASQCVTNDGRKKKTFLPSFPATCPYVTVVGATKDFGPEKVTTKKFSFIVSGGGFSNYFPRPSYQNTSVPHYLSTTQGDKDQGMFNPEGRAYPDVSAQGSRFVISVNGNLQLISGTSASTPLFASVVSLLNDARIAQNKATLGFLNPLIYKRMGNTSAFNDVYSGSAKGCGHMDGFEAAEGWDPVTGFGTPNFPTMLQQVIQL